MLNKATYLCFECDFSTILHDVFLIPFLHKPQTLNAKKQTGSMNYSWLNHEYKFTFDCFMIFKRNLFTYLQCQMQVHKPVKIILINLMMEFNKYI